jgi:threo-3-hydroxy-L-aspartate ammonia-lyase
MGATLPGALALPAYADVEAAAGRLEGVAHRTPIATSREFNARTGCEAYFKCENFQRMGAFKFRGAYNALSQLGADERARGVVAFSSGNHAQAVALAGRLLGIPAAIVMPSDAPAVKVAATRGYGADVILYDRDRESREDVARRIAAERGSKLIPPFDHAHVIAGQGTAALELGRALALKHLKLDALYVPCSGGGLVAGSALGIKSQFADCAVYAVEPMGYTRLADSLRAGERRVVTGHPPTLCDGLRAPTPGAITFAIDRRELAGAVAVDDDAVLEAMSLAAEHLKVVVEPSGAAALAALLHSPPHGSCVGVILSGGNVDAELLSKAVTRHTTI